MKKLMIFLLLAVVLLLAIGCAKKEAVEEPETAVEEPEAVEEAEEEPGVVEEVLDEPEKKIKIVEVVATETRFEPNLINLTQNERTILRFESETEHNLYAPGLQISEYINIGETDIEIPTDRTGTYTFWCNILHYGGQHSKMKGKISIE